VRHGRHIVGFRFHAMKTVKLCSMRVTKCRLDSHSTVRGEGGGVDFRSIGTTKTQSPCIMKLFF